MLPLSASSRWQTCKPGAVPGLGRAGFMTRALSLLCTILLLPDCHRPGGPSCASCFPQELRTLPALWRTEGYAAVLVCLWLCQYEYELEGLFHCVRWVTFPKNYRAVALAPGQTWNKSALTFNTRPFIRNSKLIALQFHCDWKASLSGFSTFEKLFYFCGVYSTNLLNKLEYTDDPSLSVWVTQAVSCHPISQDVSLQLELDLLFLDNLVRFPVSDMVSQKVISGLRY